MPDVLKQTKLELANCDDFQRWCHFEMGLMVHEALGPGLLEWSIETYAQFCERDDECLTVRHDDFDPDGGDNGRTELHNQRVSEGW